MRKVGRLRNDPDPSVQVHALARHFCSALSIRRFTFLFFLKEMRAFSIQSIFPSTSMDTMASNAICPKGSERGPIPTILAKHLSSVFSRNRNVLAEGKSVASRTNPQRIKVEDSENMDCSRHPFFESHTQTGARVCMADSTCSVARTNSDSETFSRKTPAVFRNDLEGFRPPPADASSRSLIQNSRSLSETPSK